MDEASLTLNNNFEPLKQLIRAAPTLSEESHETFTREMGKCTKSPKTRDCQIYHLLCPADGRDGQTELVLWGPQVMPGILDYANMTFYVQLSSFHTSYWKFLTNTPSALVFPLIPSNSICCLGLSLDSSHYVFSIFLPWVPKLMVLLLKELSLFFSQRRCHSLRPLRPSLPTYHCFCSPGED